MIVMPFEDEFHKTGAPKICGFRRGSPHINQLYVGWAAEDEWTNYTIEVTTPGRYRVKALYSYQANFVIGRHRQPPQA